MQEEFSLRTSASYVAFFERSQLPLISLYGRSVRWSVSRTVHLNGDLDQSLHLEYILLLSCPTASAELQPQATKVAVWPLVGTSHVVMYNCTMYMHVRLSK